MQPEQFLGSFAEFGIWYTSDGHKGALSSEIRFEARGNDVVIHYEDGTRHIVAGAAVGFGRFPLAGDTASGWLYLGERTLIAEYTAKVDGQEEHSLDVWTFDEDTVARSGIIRQAARTIWFEAAMERGSKEVDG
ncbi:MAG: hypothetical protein R3E84_19760 [Pseudomonadales bacterium]|nr:hypothetical protein [Pseudomonadales bacterium]